MNDGVKYIKVNDYKKTKRMVSVAKFISFPNTNTIGMNTIGTYAEYINMLLDKLKPVYGPINFIIRPIAIGDGYFIGPKYIPSGGDKLFELVSIFESKTFDTDDGKRLIDHNEIIRWRDIVMKYADHIIDINDKQQYTKVIFSYYNGLRESYIVGVIPEENDKFVDGIEVVN